jgi:YhcH/YjgK/YiaL family protein
MIKDSIHNIFLYQNISFDLKKIIEFIKVNKLNDFSEGIFEIDENLFFIVSEYYTHSFNSSLFECHKKYIDLQILIKGNELISLADSFAKVIDAYDNNKDIQFFEANSSIDLNIKENEFIIIFPHELHQPGIINFNSSKVKKAVFKIPLY